MALSPYHWFNEYQQHEADCRRWPKRAQPWRGPLRMAYVFAEGEPIVLDFRNQGDSYRIRDIPTDFLGVLIQSNDEKWSAQHSFLGQPGTTVYVPGAFDDLTAAAAALRDAYAQHVENEARIAASPTLQLERILSRYEWCSHYSDDYAVWSAGERDSRELARLIPLVPPDEVRRLWLQYAPKDIPCPV